ncbi:centaurin/arf [Anaeramoeba flamelloides]|uniref:Centaurin/arf n=1 Tax=Anaeramoeba flamelloides TaxID=1746091 RepID=A0AAV7YK93_9EUKA|nr:centaurin/arf [Anaeramoeba flamelloides]KAJ6248737.1 centaurin/arf [Anaeramoeba flamelloides]
MTDYEPEWVTNHKKLLESREKEDQEINEFLEKSEKSAVEFKKFLGNLRKALKSLISSLANVGSTQNKLSETTSEFAEQEKQYEHGLGPAIERLSTDLLTTMDGKKKLVEKYLSKELLPLVESILEETLKTAFKNKKKYDQVKKNYESANSKYDSLAKKSNLKPIKLFTALKSLQEAQTEYEHARNTCYHSFRLVNQAKKIKLLSSFNGLLEGLGNYFQLGYETMYQEENYINDLVQYHQNKAKTMKETKNQRITEWKQKAISELNLD